jgi:hypothetical protein
MPSINVPPSRQSSASSGKLSLSHDLWRTANDSGLDWLADGSGALAGRVTVQPGPRLHLDDAVAGVEEAVAHVIRTPPMIGA